MTQLGHVLESEVPMRLRSRSRPYSSFSAFIASLKPSVNSDQELTRRQADRRGLVFVRFSSTPSGMPETSSPIASTCPFAVSQETGACDRR